MACETRDRDYYNPVFNRKLHCKITPSTSLYFQVSPASFSAGVFIIKTLPSHFCKGKLRLTRVPALPGRKIHFQRQYTHLLIQSSISFNTKSIILIKSS